jgi:ZIP family zinc transporter
MNDVGTVILFALLPAAGNFAGGVLAEIREPSKRVLSWALHAAAGILIAVVAIELTPRAVASLSGWLIALAVFAGAGLYIGIKWVAERKLSDGKGRGNKGVWMVYLAIATDLASDGLMIGSGAAVSGQLGFLLALGQVLADFPEGFAVIASFRDQGASRSTRLWISASFVIPVLVAAIASFFFLRDQSEAWKIGVLMVTAGIFIVAAVEDLLPEAHEQSRSDKLSVLAFAAGFALFTIVASLTGGTG